jgi:hypothetical protein
MRREAGVAEFLVPCSWARCSVMSCAPPSRPGTISVLPRGSSTAIWALSVPMSSAATGCMLCNSSVLCAPDAQLFSGVHACRVVSCRVVCGGACACRVFERSTYVIEEDEAKGVGGLEVVEQGHHALLGDLQLGLGFACA